MRAGITFLQALRILAVSTFRGRCPHCLTHSMFKDWIDLYERCPNCGLRYQVEGGAWIGTMAIAYMVGATIAVALTILEVTAHPLEHVGLDPLWIIPIAGIASVIPAYRPAKGFWFAILYLFELTEDAPA